MKKFIGVLVFGVMAFLGFTAFLIVLSNTA
jgi:CHASE1-domain containing sensor protein